MRMYFICNLHAGRSGAPLHLDDERNSPESTSGLARRLDDDGRAIAEDLGRTLRDLGGVVANTDHAVRAERRRVLQHDPEGVLASVLAHLGVERYVAAEDLLDAGAKGADYAARPDHDATYESEVADDARALDRERGGDPVTVHLWRRCGRIHSHGLAPCEFRFRLGKKAHDPDHGILAEGRTREVAGLDLQRRLQRLAHPAVDPIPVYARGEG